jgi:hypothetical protein
MPYMYMCLHDDVCLSSPSLSNYRSQYWWHVSIEYVRVHLKQKHYSIDHQTFLRVCVRRTQEGEAIEMKKNSKYMCWKKSVRGQKLYFFCLSLDINKIRKISSFFLFINTHFPYQSNSNIAVGLNIKINKIRSLSYVYIFRLGVYIRRRLPTRIH